MTGEAVLGNYALRNPIFERRTQILGLLHKLAYRAASPAAASPGRCPRPRREGDRSARPSRELELERFELEGPFAIDPHDPTLASLETRKRILSGAPADNGSLAQSTTRILSRFATRTFRRSVGPADIKPYVDLAIGSSPDGSLDRVVQTGITAILVSPHFLFRVEQPGTPTEGKDPVPIGAFRAGFETLLFPVEQHAGRRAVSARG